MWFKWQDYFLEDIIQMTRYSPPQWNRLRLKDDALEAKVQEACTLYSKYSRNTCEVSRRQHCCYGISPALKADNRLCFKRKHMLA